MLALAVLQAQFGEELPYEPALKGGFAFRGRRVPFFNRQKGIYRAAIQRGPAALSIQTSYRSPYLDARTEDGTLYDYRAGSVDQHDNRALRDAHILGVPVVHFVGVSPGLYLPYYPCFVTDDDPGNGRVLITVGKFVGPMDDPDPVPLTDPIERRYVMREVRARVHQRRFRGVVLPAYRDQCAICRLKEIRLLDAAHIVGDLEPGGVPLISNGLSLCTIHHSAYDQNLVGISPDYDVRVSPRLLDDDDGPMLDVLKGFHGVKIEIPKPKQWRPDPARLAVRFERFERVE